MQTRISNEENNDIETLHEKFRETHSALISTDLPPSNQWRSAPI